MSTESRVQPTKMGPESKVLRSDALMQGARQVVIRHNGQDYRLQVTRSGKLILTK